MLPTSVTIRELGPREGFQTISQIIPTEQKLSLIKALVKTGVREIEVASFVRADRVPQMADAEVLVAQLIPVKGVLYRALYLNFKGFERAEQCEQISNDGWLYFSASETFLKRNSNTSNEKLLAEIPEWLTLFRKFGKTLHGVMVSAAFGCNFEGRIVPKRVMDLLKEIIGRVRDEGAPVREISLADTMGRGNPEGVRSLVGEVRSAFPESEVSLHLHDTRGTGMANVYAGLLEGVSILECSVGGLGGCPFAKGAAGNVPTEDVAFLCEELGISTGLSLEAYVAAAKAAEQIVGVPLPGKFYKTTFDAHR